MSGERAYSRLWGRGGELFNPHGRLPDFSYAGYQFGDHPIPQPRIVNSVTNFGANGSDSVDDTEAFHLAIKSVIEGAIRIPSGTYYISDRIVIDKPGIVLRGDGSGKTIIYVTSTLDQIDPQLARTGAGKSVSRYSWSGGFISVEGKLIGRGWFNIVSSARRGSYIFTVDKPEKFSLGDLVQIEQKNDPQSTLIQYLYAGDPGDIDKIDKGLKVDMYASVVAINQNEIRINRPLRWDLRSEWTPTVRVATPTVEEVGVEGITIRFAPEKYHGHFTEVGRNAISFTGTINCWAQDIVIENADSGIFFKGTQGTLKDIVIRSQRPPKGNRTGHHGITLSSDNLLDGFVIETEFFHDITVTQLSAGNVIKNGRAINLTLDHHKGANHANLFTNLHAGLGTQVWKSGGAPSLGKHAGAWSTYWCIQSERHILYPPSAFAPEMINLVGVQTVQPQRTDSEGIWFETMDPHELQPQDLHRAQLERRKALGR